MAETGNQILGKILGVLDEINKKTGGPTPQPTTTTGGDDKGKGKTAVESVTISNIINKLLDPKTDGKKVGKNITSLASALKDLSTVKFNVFNKLALNSLTKSLKGLVDFAIYVGDNSKKVRTGAVLIGLLSKSISHMATVLPRFLGYLALSMVGFVLSLVVIAKILKSDPAGAAIAFAGTIITVVGVFLLVGKLGKGGTMKDGIFAAKGMATALMYLSGGMVLFATAIALIPRILGVGAESKKQKSNEYTAALGAILVAGSLTTMAIGFALLGTGKEVIEDGSDVIRGMSIGMMYLALGMISFAIAVALIPRILGVGAESRKNTLGAVLGVSLIIGSVIGFAFGYMALGKAEEPIKKGTSTIKEMSIGMLLLSGSMLAFAMSVALVPRIMGVGPNSVDKGKKGAAAALGAIVIMGSIALFALGFAGIGILDKTGNVKKGAITAMFIGGAIAILSIAMMMFATTAKKISDLADTSATRTKKDGTIKQKGKMGQLLAGIGPGLGAMGIILVAAAGLFAVLGMPPVALVVGLGAVVAIGISVALISISKAIKAVAEAVKDVDASTIVNNISMAVSSVIKGITLGINEGFGVKSAKDIDFKGFRKTRRAMKLLGNIATSVSKFAEGLRAFGQAGKIAKLSYKEIKRDGEVFLEPVIDKSNVVNVTDVAANLAISLGIFIEHLITATDGIKAKNLRKLKRALGGRDGLMGPIVGFGELLQMYSNSSKEGMIPATDPETGEIVKNTAGQVVYLDMKDLAIKVATGFGTFIKAFSDALPDKLDKLKKKDINKLSDLSVAINDLANSQTSLDKVATSIGTLATNIGALSVNLKALDVQQLAKVTYAAAEYEKRSKSGIIADSTVASTSNIPVGVSKLSEDEMRMLAQLIGEQLSSSFKNKPFTFKFATGETAAGVLQ